MKLPNSCLKFATVHEDIRNSFYEDIIPTTTALMLSALTVPAIVTVANAGIHFKETALTKCNQNSNQL